MSQARQLYILQDVKRIWSKLGYRAAWPVDGESPLRPGLLDGHETIGLTAGASTPEELVQSVLTRLADRDYDEVEEVTVAREDVQFRLPREVA